MALPNVYTQTYGQIPDFFSKIQDGQAPEIFTQQHLKDLGFTSSNHRSFIPLLKAIGFLTAEGAPTERYRDYRDRSQAKHVLGRALKETYSDLFVIKANPTEKDAELFEGKFKSTHNVSDRLAQLMRKTFFAMLKIAVIDQAPQPKKVQSKPEKDQKPQPEPPAVQDIGQIPIHTTGLHYNIQIHLPATKDVEVYNAIFKSLREHLID